MTVADDKLAGLTRPIIGIENRTAQEVFDIMCDRIIRALPASGGEAGVVTEQTIRAALTAFTEAVREQDREWTEETDEGEELIVAPNGDFFALRIPLLSAISPALSLQQGGGWSRWRG